MLDSVLYICHVNTPFAEVNLRKLCAEVPEMDIWLLYDNSNEELNMELPLNCNVYVYNKEKIQSHGYKMYYWYPLRRGNFYGHNFEYVIPCFFQMKGKITVIFGR